MTFTEDLRRRVQARLVCPTCGQPTYQSSLADGIGVARSTLWRFLGGSGPSADLVDKLVAWLDTQEDTPP